jgi:hypothetical protein
MTCRCPNPQGHFGNNAGGRSIDNLQPTIGAFRLANSLAGHLALRDLGHVYVVSRYGTYALDQPIHSVGLDCFLSF